MNSACTGMQDKRVEAVERAVWRNKETLRGKWTHYNEHDEGIRLPHIYVFRMLEMFHQTYISKGNLSIVSLSDPYRRL